MPPRPGLSAGLVQDYLQRPRVQYNIINNIILGGYVKVPSNMFTSLARVNIYEFNLEWRNSE